MKKVLSFVLAAVMVLSLSTVAFAATIDMEAGLEEDGASGIVLNMIDNNGEGAKHTVTINTGRSTADDFAVTAKIKKGSDVVKATVKAADKKVEIQAIPDWSWSLNDSEAFEVIVTVKATGKGHREWTDLEYTVKGTVVLAGEADLTEEFTGASATDIDTENYEDYDVASGSVIKCGDKVEDVKLNFAMNDNTMWMEFGKMYDQGNVLVVYNSKAIKAIQKANIDAELSVYNFVSAPEFDTAGKLVLDVDEDSFIYEYVDGKLVASKFAWDEEEYAWVLKTNVLGCYVVSDIELANVAADAPVANPSTGASDMVNVAVAMAVVSIAAAGAVALKK